MFDAHKPETFSLTPRELYSELTQRVVGQDNACRIVARAACAHYASIASHGTSSSSATPSHNVLLLGNSGMGKTTLARALSETLGVPYHICDAARLTSEGYVGPSVSDIFASLYRSSENMTCAEHGLVVLDEIDKKASRPSGGRDISGGDVTEQLYAALEGTTLHLNPGPTHANTDFSTKNILFIGMGAFEGIDEVVKKRTRTGDIGFSTPGANAQGCSITRDDLIEYGFSRQFIGRFSSFCTLDELTFDDYLTIARMSSYPGRASFEAAFAHYGVQLAVGDDALACWAEHAVHSKTGARALREAMAQTFGPLLDHVDEFAGKRIKLDAQAARDPATYVSHLVTRADELELAPTVISHGRSVATGVLTFAQYKRILVEEGYEDNELTKACAVYLTDRQGKFLVTQMPGHIDVLRDQVQTVFGDLSQTHDADISLSQAACSALVCQMLHNGIEPYQSIEYLEGRLEPLQDSNLMQGIDELHVREEDLEDLESLLANTKTRS